jgi:hypothetical protein
MKQLVRKTYVLDQRLINRLKKETRARTETEAITAAMEECLFRRDLFRWHERHAGKFRLKDTDA